MKYAIFSDIQGNYPKLESFLESTISENIDKFICLGDLTQHGTDFNDNRCIDALKKLEGIVISGNHEEEILKNKKESLKKISLANLDFIKSLPSKFLLENKYLLTHKALSSISNNGRIRSAQDMQKESEFLAAQYPNVQMCFSGHSHKAFLFEYDPNKYCMKKLFEGHDLFGKMFNLDNKKHYLANPGGIGLYYNLPTSYLIFDTTENSIKFKLIK